MSKHTVVLMPGDGIGAIVLEQAVRVLNKVGFDADYEHADIGWECWRRDGDPLPQKTIDLLDKYRVGLFGAITSKPRADAEKELHPGLKEKGLVYYSPIVALRQRFGLDISVRPCKSFQGNPLNFVINKGYMHEPMVDVVVFRQNTEGLYSGVEWTNPPRVVLDALKTHPKMRAFDGVPPEDLAISCRIFTRGACRRIVEEAFLHADRNGYKSVTVCEKPNVIRETSGMMLAEAQLAHKRYPHIQLWDTNIDAQMMWLTKNPEDYGVIVCGNMFGDIVSDGFAGLVGGLGFAASANVGKDCAVFEPTHGSAPKYAEYKTPIVNPIAMILSACMMLDHLGEKGMSDRIANAIRQVVREGKVLTYDMAKMKGAPDVVTKGAASTIQMTDAIIDRL